MPPALPPGRIPGRSPEGHPAAPAPDQTPTLYRAWSWRLARLLSRAVPAPVLKGAGLAFAELAWRFAARRRDVVVENLQPAATNPQVALETAHRLFRQFALKLTDLWRYENGAPVEDWFATRPDWGPLAEVIARGRGVLLLTAHLGNWELGGALLASRGVRLFVITQAEPGRSLTELRRHARALRGVETLVVGNDSFGSIEIVKRLQEGAAVAMLIDRPARAQGAPVQFFGRPFHASAAAAELARASGCALVGVGVVRSPDGYVVRLLPEFQYDRRSLGQREARCQLTEQILRAFEPEIREHLDQWYQFVPLWPDSASLVPVISSDRSGT